MTREEIYAECLDKIQHSKTLMLEVATGAGKSRMAIDLVNHLVSTKFPTRQTSMLLLVAKTVHKQTWKDEIEKWGGLKVDRLVVECYESLKKHTEEYFDFIVCDEVHHVGSDLRIDFLDTLKFQYMLGLSATIPRDLKYHFKWVYKAQLVSCDITEAIQSEILPEPTILLYPLTLDDTKATETWEINPKSRQSAGRVDYSQFWRWKNTGYHVVCQCTQKQKMQEMDALIEKKKNLYMRSRQKALENIWLQLCGKRLEYLATCKNPIVLQILDRLKDERTITFCKTIKQAEILGQNCIHSKNKEATDIYNAFNNKEINHITAVNILNENANLVDCKYAIFANLSSSDIVIPQRLGRSMRHKHPVIIVPYYKDTREEEVVNKMFGNYKKEFIKVIHSIDEI